MYIHTAPLIPALPVHAMQVSPRLLDGSPGVLGSQVSGIS